MCSIEGMHHKLFFQADKSVSKFETCEKYYHSFDCSFDYSQDSSTLNVSRDSNETTVTTDEDVDRGDGVSKILYDIPGYNRQASTQLFQVIVLAGISNVI